MTLGRNTRRRGPWICCCGASTASSWCSDSPPAPTTNKCSSPSPRAQRCKRPTARTLPTLLAPCRLRRNEPNPVLHFATPQHSASSSLARLDSKISQQFMRHLSLETAEGDLTSNPTYNAVSYALPEEVTSREITNRPEHQDPPPHGAPGIQPRPWKSALEHRVSPVRPQNSLCSQPKLRQGWFFTLLAPLIRAPGINPQPPGACLELNPVLKAHKPKCPKSLSVLKA
eukprot:193049-Prorocentrum_minimum.AAC.5